jgi:hypothetical protein
MRGCDARVKYDVFMRAYGRDERCEARKPITHPMMAGMRRAEPVTPKREARPANTAPAPVTMMGKSEIWWFPRAPEVSPGWACGARRCRDEGVAV